MGIIKLKNIRTFSFHGCLEEEGKIGSDYSIDLMVKADFLKAADSDDLAMAIDYVHLNKIVVEEMDIRSKLLEHVCQRILNRVLHELPGIEQVTVGVSKINPPLGGDVEMVTVEMEEFRS